VKLTRRSSRPGRRLVATAAGAALVAGCLAGCTSTLGYALVVNGTAISQNKINQELAEIASNKMYVTYIEQGGTVTVKGSGGAGTYNKAFVAALVNEQVSRAIIRQQLVALKALPPASALTSAKSEATQEYPAGIFAAFPAAYQTLLATEQAEADAFVHAAAATMAAGTVEQYYQAHQNDYDNEACIRIIQIADKNGAGQIDATASQLQAQDIKSQLDAGGDFASLAKQFSADNGQGGSAAAGGNLSGSAPDGCLDAQEIQTVLSTAPAVASLPLNQVSNPVLTQTGVYLIEVTSRSVAPLNATVTLAIDQQLASARLNSLVAKAHVKINPEFGSFDTQIDANGVVTGVIPPIVPNSAALGATTATTAPPAGASGSTSGG
jgi:PPIC-type PPIASE domain